MFQESGALSSAKRTIEQSLKMPVSEQPAPDSRIDACFRVGDVMFLVEVKSTARGATVSQAVASLQPLTGDYPDAAPLLIVPSMGNIGAQICERAGINWIDLHGNASIHEQNLRVFIRGCRKTDDALSISASGLNPFGRKASRVVHTLLTNPNRTWTRSEIEASTGLDKGYISKIVAELSEQHYVTETFKGKRSVMSVVEPAVLLDAWSERYRRDAPVLWGLIAARDGFETVHKLADILNEADADFALTGLASAAQYSKFGSFRRVDAYIGDVLPDKIQSQLHIGSDQRGRNVALFLDKANVSIGAVEQNRVKFASPVITYLDLSTTPERSDEARDEMRRYLENQWA